MCQFIAPTAAGAFIAAGQALTLHRNASIVHAGILFDDMIEALSKGISAADLRIQDRNPNPPAPLIVPEATGLAMAMNE
jgi:hypothetical protein